MTPGSNEFDFNFRFFLNAVEEEQHVINMLWGRAKNKKQFHHHTLKNMAVMIELWCRPRQKK